MTDAATGKGVREARISLGDTVLSTDSEGGYKLEHRPSQGILQVLAPGYRRAQIDLAQRPRVRFEIHRVVGVEIAEIW